jgi:hypothetical protein
MVATGAVTRLLAVGAQDEHISGSPEVSFFQSNFRRHSHFSMFQQQQDIQGNPEAGKMSTVKIRRSGDLLNYCFLTLEQNGANQLVTEWSNVIEYTELVIGDQVIDQQTSEFTQELAIDLFAQNFAKSYQASLHGGLGSESYFYPLRHFFCESWSSSLPLIAIQYSDISIRIKWSSNFNSAQIPKFYATYFMLDTLERAHFAKPDPIQLPIFQVQKMIPSNTMTQTLAFNHPVKYIASSNAYGNNTLVSVTNKVSLEVNGIDITDTVVSVPFFTAVPSYYHTDYSSSNAENMFFYPFCLNTAKHQMTGTLNFSRIDSFRVKCTQPINRNIYGVNYNFLRIENGMCGLMYLS